MATFEGPLMSIKVVNSLSHYTDWTIGHVHSGALGWVGFVSFGALYCLVPWLWERKGLYSLKLVEWHFWIATIGIVLYISAMWVSGIMQGLMWRAYTALGFLEYSFIETVEAMHPFYIIRAAGRRAVPDRRADHGLQSLDDGARRRGGTSHVARRVFSRRNEERSNVILDHGIKFSRRTRSSCSVGILVVVAIGGLVEITPLFYLKSTIEEVDGIGPTRRWNSTGRNIYVREGCYLCHSQMIRPLRDEVERYGHYSASPPRACTTIRSSGARSAPVPIWRASAASIPTNGTSRI